ncbi:hypothetical protein N0V82_000493 [Gnomoniopsis sp. IMI 355080]|nr:hypothetical protein N0V82_000493 [Gnomoniopsis sp. IMI 355080]
MSPSLRAPPLLFRRIPAISSQNLALTRLAQRPTIRCVATTAETATLPQRSFLRRAFSWTLRAFFFTTLGFTMAASPAYATVSGYLTPKSDQDTLREWTPTDDKEQAYEDYINAHPLVQSLRANAAFAESRPHLKIPPAWRVHNLTAGTLMGPDRVPFPPLSWLDAEGPKKEYVQLSFVGQELCGHPGIVHGGYLATVLDEGMARTAFAALPRKVGMTANLNINYKAPCMAGQYIVLKSELTKSEGRKAWVEGRIETLPKDGEEPVVLAEATALYIEPKQAAALSNYYSAT